MNTLDVNSNNIIEILKRSKICCHCKELKLFDCFWKDSSNNDGYSYKCKGCSKKYLKSYSSRENIKKLRKNREQIFLLEGKKCRTCKKLKFSSEFSKSSRSSDGYQTICKLCQSEYIKEYNSQENRRVINKKITKEKLDKFYSILKIEKEIPCNRCKIIFPYYVMDFHHKDPKDKLYNIGNMANRSLSVVRKEIEKCEVLCSNCHRIIEHESKLKADKLF